MSPAIQVPIVVAETAAPEIQQIGDARMMQDGTIILRVRMVQGGNVGDGEYRYAPGSPDYKRVRAHLPNLKPGGNVPIYNDWE
jgi:hypothetical protein